MKTVEDIYKEIGIPCYYCKYAFSPECNGNCINPLLCYMCDIADDMVLKGEYYG